jgi:hypothetical protein
MSYIAELVGIQRNGSQTRLHKVVKYDLPAVVASNVDKATGGFEAFNIGGSRWKVRRLLFKKPPGQMQPERVYLRRKS